MIELLRRGFQEGITARGIQDALGQHSDDLSADDVERLAIVLEQFLHAVPDALSSALAMSRDERCGRSVGFATGSILTYLFDDEDLLPEASFGILGLLDDAYLVHLFEAILRQTYPYVDPSTSYAAPDGQALEIVASLLPDGVAHALFRTAESTIQVAHALFPARDRGVLVDGAVPPEIRVDEALRVAG
jgi:hypothetical protein